MGLSIYEEPNPSAAFSIGGEYTNPLTMTVDGILGAIIIRRYYVRNDDVSKYYTNIQVLPTVNHGLDIVSGATPGFEWKLIAGDPQPLEDQWSNTPPGQPISLPDIGEAGSGDITTYLPFWLRVDVARSTDVQSFENVSLDIEADENLV